MSIKGSVWIRLGGIGLALAGLCFVWSQAPPPKQPIVVQKVTGDLWVLMTNNSGNVAVLPTSAGVLLVDDKYDQDGPDIMAKVKAISDQPIKYILNTHQHGDHTGGNAFMLTNTPAEILIHKNARANMVAGKQPGLPQITYADDAQVFIGGKEVSAHHVGRGHTNGDAVILFPSERVLHTGDLFVNGSAPFIDYSAMGSLVDWDKTLDRVLALDFDIVIPGHGPVAKKADLVKWRDSIAELRSRARMACAGGAAGAEKRLNLSGLNMDDSLGFMARSMPGICAELAN
ncbi:MAG TPA: MBL fold metallo-hydrolase [Bryobacteraceae bacterium]|nr:MBL fold metallo-hydrolase [Bryobacteraceae bacterium]